MNKFVRAIAAALLPITSFIGVIFCAGAIATGLLALARGISPLLAGVAVAVLVGALATTGFLFSARSLLDRATVASERIYPELSTATQRTRQFFIAGSVVGFFALLALVATLWPDPLRPFIVVPLTAAAALRGTFVAIRFVRTAHRSV